MCFKISGQLEYTQRLYLVQSTAMQKEGSIIIYAYKANCLCIQGKLFIQNIHLLTGRGQSRKGSNVYFFLTLSSLSLITSNEQSGLNISLKIYSAFKEATLILNQVCLNKLQLTQ